MRTLPQTFQRLTDDDRDRYGEPAVISLRPPEPPNERCAGKLASWIEWRAASYPAPRHSQYLYRPDVDGASGPKILVSAVMAAPASMDDYLASISPARRYDVGGRKAANRGYTAQRIVPREHAEGIWDVIHSTDERQGRPIAPMFADRPRNHDFADYADYGDERYNDICTGVFAPGGALAAYLLGKRVGEHVQYDEIMGHGEHVANDVMYLLHFQFLGQCSACSQPPQCLNYGSWYSGNDPFSAHGGLNRWKRKVHFKPAYLILACS